MAQSLYESGFITYMRTDNPVLSPFAVQLAREFAIPYESEILKTVLYAAEMKADPVHPNAHGYRRMAEAVAALLRKAGAI